MCSFLDSSILFFSLFFCRYKFLYPHMFLCPPSHYFCIVRSGVLIVPIPERTCSAFTQWRCSLEVTWPEVKDLRNWVRGRSLGCCHGIWIHMSSNTGPQEALSKPAIFCVCCRDDHEGSTEIRVYYQWWGSGYKLFSWIILNCASTNKIVWNINTYSVISDFITAIKKNIENWNECLLAVWEIAVLSREYDGSGCILILDVLGKPIRRR